MRFSVCTVLFSHHGCAPVFLWAVYVGAAAQAGLQATVNALSAQLETAHASQRVSFLLAFSLCVSMRVSLCVSVHVCGLCNRNVGFNRVTDVRAFILLFAVFLSDGCWLPASRRKYGEFSRCVILFLRSSRTVTETHRTVAKQTCQRQLQLRNNTAMCDCC